MRAIFIFLDLIWLCVSKFRGFLHSIGPIIMITRLPVAEVMDSFNRGHGWAIMGNFA